MVAVFVARFTWALATPGVDESWFSMLRAQAAQFRVDVTEAESLRGRIKSGDSARALPAIIEASAKEAGLRESIKQIQPLSNERSQLNLSNVAFDALVPWLARLAEAEGVSVETISASGASAAGRVQVESLVLRTARAR